MSFLDLAGDLRLDRSFIGTPPLATLARCVEGVHTNLQILYWSAGFFVSFLILSYDPYGRRNVKI